MPGVHQARHYVIPLTGGLGSSRTGARIAQNRPSGAIGAEQRQFPRFPARMLAIAPGVRNASGMGLEQIAQIGLTIAAIASIGLVPDQLLRPDYKKAVADFVFSRTPTRIAQFERSSIQGLIGIFLHSDKSVLSPIKVWLYSLSMATVFVLMIILQPSDIKVNVPSLILAIPFLSYLLFPADLLSLYIAKRVFYNREYRAIHAPGLWLLYVAIIYGTILIPLMIFVESIEPSLNIDSITLDVMGAFLLLGIILSVSFIIVVHSASVLFGIVLNLISRALRWRTDFGAIVKIEEFPFTIALLTGYVLVQIALLAAWTLP